MTLALRCVWWSVTTGIHSSIPTTFLTERTAHRSAGLVHTGDAAINTAPAPATTAVKKLSSPDHDLRLEYSLTRSAKTTTLSAGAPTMRLRNVIAQAQLRGEPHKP